jgi:hypothetical protein
VNDERTVIANVRASTQGISIMRYQRASAPEEIRVLPWRDTGIDEIDYTAAFLRGCLADAYHVGRTEALNDIQTRPITDILFGIGVKACPDEDRGQPCNYCKTEAVMTYLASVILTAH